jgi:hypothetical protein
VERRVTYPRWILPALLLLLLLLLLPMPLAERYTSPTQDGQYLLNPLRAYGFLMAVARSPSDSRLGTSGAALAQAKVVFSGSAYQPTKVHLLYFPAARPHSYTTRTGQVLELAQTPQFVWEVWGVPVASGGPDVPSDVIALLDYGTGEVLARLPEPPTTH